MRVFGVRVGLRDEGLAAGRAGHGLTACRGRWPGMCEDKLQRSPALLMPQPIAEELEQDDHYHMPTG